MHLNYSDHCAELNHKKMTKGNDTGIESNGL